MGALPSQDLRDPQDSQDSQDLQAVLVPKETEDFQELQAVSGLLAPPVLKVLQDSPERRETPVML